MKPFFKARKRSLILHNAAFDLKVTAPLLRPGTDFYQAVDAGPRLDTMILRRLLSLATAGHTARESSLAACALEYLNVVLEKGQVDAQGKQVRTSFGQFLGRPPLDIPAQYLTYLAQDALATWHLFDELHKRIKRILQDAQGRVGLCGRVPSSATGRLRRRLAP